MLQKHQTRACYSGRLLELAPVKLLEPGMISGGCSGLPLLLRHASVQQARYVVLRKLASAQQARFVVLLHELYRL